MVNYFIVVFGLHHILYVLYYSLRNNTRYCNFKRDRHNFKIGINQDTYLSRIKPSSLCDIARSYHCTSTFLLCSLHTSNVACHCICNFSPPFVHPKDALVGFGWSFSEIPSNSLNDITFPISVPDAPKRKASTSHSSTTLAMARL